jgi:hypothetical protein
VALLTGDLFHAPVAADADVDFVIERLAELAPMPVLAIPGDCDPHGPDSVWNGALRLDRGRRPWPDNVHVFPPGQWRTLRFDSLPGYAFVGQGHPVAGGAERPLAARVARPDDAATILLHHGSLTGRRPAEGPTPAPYTEAEALAQGVAYVALGHAGRVTMMKDAAGRLRAADAGPCVADWPPTPGERGVLVGRLDGPADAPAVELTPAPVDARALREVRIDLSGAATADEVRRRLVEAAAAAGACPADLLHVVAGGLYPAALEPPRDQRWTDLGYFHLQTDYTAARPDYDLEALREDGRGRSAVDRRFVAQMMSQIEAADGEERAAPLEHALYLVLDGLRQGRLRIRD